MTERGDATRFENRQAGESEESVLEQVGVNDTLQTTVSMLLAEVRAGNRSAFDDLVQIVYEELRDLARAQRHGWQGDETLNTTALVNEAYQKLAAQDEPRWESRAHFRSVAARAMRQVLIDYSRARCAAKRGGKLVRMSFDELRVAGSSGELSDQHARLLIALDQSLERLIALDSRQGRVVECRFFGGMTIPDTAEALGVSRATVQRDWLMAKSWLYRDMQQELDSEGLATR
jgi:RNA polymerase sigma factor (TIGR02999 family)